MATVNNIQEWFNSLPLKKKIILIGTLLMSIGSILVFISWSQRTDYQVLYSNLSEEDSGLIIQKLKEQRVPYKVTAGGILVPSDRVHSLRLELAAQGLPQGGGVGFEIFDKRDFTMTDFIQKLNYQRALQGELSRTIRSLQEVDSCRVHLAIPEKGLFSKEEDRPKASVFVRLKPGKRLSQSQIQGIVHLVSSSVDGLSPQDVTVVDNRGELLTTPKRDDLIFLTQNQIEFQTQVERNLEERIISILEPVVGKGRVRAKVSAQIDFTKIEKTEERYDPDSQVVRSEQKTVEKSSKSSPGGVPGVSSNIPGKSGSNTSANSYSEKKIETVNYEISKAITHTVVAPGEIKRITAVAIVDGSYEQVEGGKQRKYIPRTPEEITHFENMVKNAIGFVAKRGDDVRVVNMPFEQESTLPEESPEEHPGWMPFVMTVTRYAIPVIGIVLLFLFVIRPIIKAISSTPPVKTGLPKTVAEIERTLELQGVTRPDILEWARNNPQKAAQLIKGWIEEK